MSISVWFWAIYVLSLIFTGWGWSRLPAEGRWGAAWPLLFYVLFGLLGWAAFGSPVKG